MDFNEFKTLLMSDRSIRRFDANCSIDEDTLLKLVDLTRYCASGRNAQPLKYRLVYDRGECAAVFKHLKWAGYYTDWDGPSVEERPTAYLVQCIDESLASDPMADDGLQLQAMTLGAATIGLGACIIKAFDVKAVSDALKLPYGVKPIYVLEIGVPAEKSRIVDMQDGNYRYYRDKEDMQCVPKRSLREIVISMDM